MNLRIIKTLFITLLLLPLCALGNNEPTDKIRIMLVGDSTTIGNLPRQVNPEGPHLEKMIEQLAHAQHLPSLDVINTGKGGETA